MSLDFPVVLHTVNSGLWVRSTFVSLALPDRTGLHTNALVSELATNLVDSLETTDDELLQIQLRRNAEEKFHVQLVVVCLEWACSSTSSDLVHHGCLDFEEIALIKILANELDDLGAGDEGLAGRVVHDEIEETVAVALLLVFVSTGKSSVEFNRNSKKKLTSARWATSSGKV